MTDWQDISTAPKDMDIYTPVGSRVIFMGRNGYPTQLSHALSVLQVGQEYTIASIVVGGWETSVRIEESPGWFNSVMFCNVPAPPTPKGGA